MKKMERREEQISRGNVTIHFTYEPKFDAWVVTKITNGVKLPVLYQIICDMFAKYPEAECDLLMFDGWKMKRDDSELDFYRKVTFDLLYS